MNAKTNAAAPLPYHYYATTAFGWAVAETREKAIAGVARQAGTDIIKRNVKNSNGLYVWSARVELPQAATYDINNYVPSFITKDGQRTEQRVPTSTIIVGRIQNIKGHLVIEDSDGSEG